MKRNRDSFVRNSNIFQLEGKGPIEATDLSVVLRRLARGSGTAVGHSPRPGPAQPYSTFLLFPAQPYSTFLLSATLLFFSTASALHTFSTTLLL